ncbi:MAG: hypothetical protein QGF31_06550 [Nitrospinota bacterium]|nr:hypothetical protein [Nitrospinota bacterium]
MSLIKYGIKEGKEIIEAGSEQASFQIGIAKKKLKIYRIQKKIEIVMTKLGEILYNFFQQNRKDIKNDKQVTGLVESIKKQKEEIKKTEQEIADIQSNSEGSKEKLCDSGKNIFEKIKKGLNLSGEITESADTQSKPSLQQKASDVEKEKKGKKVKKTSKEKPLL